MCDCALGHWFCLEFVSLTDKVQVWWAVAFEESVYWEVVCKARLILLPPPNRRKFLLTHPIPLKHLRIIISHQFPPPHITTQFSQFIRHRFKNLISKLRLPRHPTHRRNIPKRTISLILTIIPHRKIATFPRLRAFPGPVIRGKTLVEKVFLVEEAANELHFCGVVERHESAIHLRALLRWLRYVLCRSE